MRQDGSYQFRGGEQLSMRRVLSGVLPLKGAIGVRATDDISENGTLSRWMVQEQARERGCA